MRRVVIDTETTGFEYATHDRVIEIAAVELDDTKMTGEYWHTYLNPRVRISDGALKVHHITNEFLDGKPEFCDAYEDLIDFIGNCPIIGHGYAQFDRHFIAKECRLIHKPEPDNEIIDTLLIARNVRPGKRNSLDQLVKDFNIKNTREGTHGALVDADLTARVFAHFKQTQGNISMDFDPAANEAPEIEYQPTVVIKATEEELNLHAAMCKALKIKAWQTLPPQAK